MLSNKNLIFVCSFFVCCLLLLHSSCVYYQRYPMPKARLSKINPEPLSFYVIDAAHPLTRVWYVAEMQMKDQQISGFLSRLSEKEAMDITVVRNQRDGKESRNDILLYTTPKLLMGFGDTLTTTIPFKTIERVEVHEPNYGKTLGNTIISGATAFFLIGMLSLQID